VREEIERFDAARTLRAYFNVEQEDARLCATIRSGKRSGPSTANLEELRTVLDFLRKGDVLMVTRIDRLARGIVDLQDIVRTVRAKGASLRATEQPIDTSTAAGKCFLDVLGYLLSSRRTAGSGSLRASPRPRLPGSTRGGLRRST
jgi:DNA invertase Pin-like site-specific DNA recombinase